jgi:hypothetical protein
MDVVEGLKVMWEEQMQDAWLHIIRGHAWEPSLLTVKPAPHTYLQDK